MKRGLKIASFFLYICMIFNVQNIAAEDLSIKVLVIETGDIVKEMQSSEEIDNEVQKAIKGITGVTVQANPIPKEGYLIKIPLTKSIKVKNKWFEELVSEVLLLYNPSLNKQGKIILYTDENTPLSFDIDYDFTQLLIKLNID